jgi:hypothetical protein
MIKTPTKRPSNRPFRKRGRNAPHKELQSNE